MQKQLADAQERLHLISKLSNTLAPESELTTDERGDAAHLIHQLCDGRELSSDTYHDVAGLQITSKRSQFMTA